ncbi:SDR family NAD(P)-dependent oxidoreductase [Streptomyces bottropensis]|uniref:SDR family NAD(P)-dependent oxidoreductase n=1 Tax=Streptomyces bottropensis TaxID=42235 RepID=UPI00381EAB71
MASITDRTILIVGASTGIGAEVARRLGHGGNRLVATARRDPELAALARDVRAAGSACLDIPADALDPQAAADVGGDRRRRVRIHRHRPAQRRPGTGHVDGRRTTSA